MASSIHSLIQAAHSACNYVSVPERKVRAQKPNRLTRLAGGQAGQPATVASRNIVNNRAACLHALSANSLHVSASAELLGQTDVRSLS